MDIFNMWGILSLIEPGAGALKMYCQFSSTCSSEFCANQYAGNCKRKSKMTREEAVKKVMLEYADPNNTKQGVSFVKSLEALGLLKFDVASGPDCRELVFSSQKPLAYQVIAQLQDLGYKVDKRS